MNEDEEEEEEEEEELSLYLASESVSGKARLIYRVLT